MSNLLLTNGTFILAIAILCFMVIDLNMKLTNKEQNQSNGQVKESTPPTQYKGGGEETDSYVYKASGKRMIYFGQDPEWPNSIYDMRRLFVLETATLSLQDIKERSYGANSEQSMVLYCKIVYVKNDTLYFKVADLYGEATFEADVNRLSISDDMQGLFMGHYCIFKVFVSETYEIKILSVSATRYRKEVV